MYALCLALLRCHLSLAGEVVCVWYTISLLYEVMWLLKLPLQEEYMQSGRVKSFYNGFVSCAVWMIWSGIRCDYNLF